MKILKIATFFVVVIQLNLIHQGFAQLQTEVKDYFKEVALGSEFGEDEKVIKKWNENVKIYVKGDIQPHLDKELNTVINELNSLIKTIRIERVYNKREANCEVFLGTADEFISHMGSRAKNLVKSNKGLFFVNYNKKGELYKATVFVDTFRASVIAQRHLLREELTQSLGLMNDSYKYKDSMFYQPWSTTQNYSDIDKQLIKLLYNPKMQAGISSDEVDGILKDIKNP